MALGDLTLFNDFARQLAEKEIDLADDTYKLALVSNTLVPVVTQATPTYSTYSGNEVSGSGYAAGGATVSSTMAVSLSVATASWTVGSGPHATWTATGGGPSNIRWGILYNDTAGSKQAAAFVDIGAGSDVNLATTSIYVTFNVTAIAQLTVS